MSGVFCHNLQLVNRNVAEFCNSKSKWQGVGGEGQPGGLSEDLHVILLVVTPLKGSGLSSYPIDRCHHGPYMGNVCDSVSCLIVPPIARPSFHLWKYRGPTLGTVLWNEIS